MRIVLVTLCCLISSLAALSQETATAEEINWMSWEEAVAANKEKPRKIFVDVYTNWCGWCKKMDASTFKDPDVVQAMNNHYYAVKFNAETKDTLNFRNNNYVNTAPQGKRGTHTFAMALLDSRMSYPSYAILDENFNRVTIIKGYQKKAPFLGNMLFFGTNEYVRFQQYQQQQAQKQQAAVPQSPAAAPKQQAAP
ncbi:MAG: DUF255 domain-containing protein [Bacteroidota bacterium]